MQVNSQAQALDEIPEILLTENAGDHAGQHIAGAAGGHPGIAGRVDVRGTIGRRDHGAEALQYDVNLMLGREAASNFDAIIDNLRNPTANQSGHLSRMRREYPRLSVAANFIGVSDKRI